MRSNSETHKGKQRKITGFSLVEIIIAITIFGLVVGSISVFSLQAFRAAKNGRQRISGSTYLQEITDALIIIKSQQWPELLENCDGQPKHIEFSDNSYHIVEGVEDKGDAQVSFVIEPAYRNGDDEIVTTGGEEDVHTRKITATVTWTDVLGQQQQLESVLYVNDWHAEEMQDTTEADFNAGIHDLTVVTNNEDGEVETHPAFYPNWCNPIITMSSYDLPGEAVGNTIKATPGHAFVGTGYRFWFWSGDMSFMHLLIDDSEPPIVTVEGTFDGYKVNDIFGENNYVYLASDDYSKEAIIVDVSEPPYTEIGHYDASLWMDSDAIFIQGNRGYVGQWRRLHVFDLTEKTGSRPHLGSMNVGSFFSVVTDLYVRGNYAFVSLHNDNDELVIIDISDPSDMREVAYANVNTEQAASIYVTEDGNRVYMGTDSGSGDEFFIIDSSNKSGQLPVIGSYDTGGLDVHGLTVVEDRAILVGTGTGQEYQVLDIEDENNPIYCGGTDIDDGLSDVASVAYNDKLFSYVISGETNAELKIIEGGAGGGNQFGEGYVEAGTFYSRVIDSGTDNPYYFSLDWNAHIPTGSTLSLQIRTGPNTDLSSEPWVGPDGTTGSYFTSPGGYEFPESLNNNRYFQYKADFTSDTIETAVLEDLMILYQAS